MCVLACLLTVWEGGKGKGKGGRTLKGLCMHYKHPPPKTKQKNKKDIGRDERWVVQGGDKVVRAGG